MQRLFFLIAIVLFFHPVEVYAQNALRAITEVEYYDFYNSIVNPDSITKFNLEYSASFGDTFSATTDDIPMLIGVSKEELFKNGISEQDIQFMNIQIVKGDKYKWKANRIAGSRILHATNKKRDYKHYSIPL
ncbi:MAG TPA: hypothetical protein VK174_13575, partial [Chitinophagales bacterium]|nr:hypothetical protein [Chitinophagales bacterium]